MVSRKQGLDPVGPFGNPDGSRADIEDVISEFVDFGGNPAYGHLATRANDSKVRVIVGKLGAGKTVYLRRLQDFQAHQDSVYADVPQQSLPKTEVVVKACQWFSNRVLVEKWMQIWERAIIRSLASHVLCHPELRQQMDKEQADEIRNSYRRLLDDFRRPRSIYSQVRDIINGRHTAHQLSTYLDDPLWDDLEYLLAEILSRCKPVYFYLDAVDEEFSHAPMYWLKCQEGLFYQVMRLLRDHRLGGRLHVVVCIRDIVMSSVYQSEHAPRYYNEPHIRVLTWDRGSLLYLLQRKLQRLEQPLLMRRSTSGEVTIRDWLGINGDWPGPDGSGTVEDYLLSHTRLIPRDIISLGNELCEEVLRQKHTGHKGLPPAAIDDVVGRCAKRFGDSQLAQCANQVSSDMMPKDAARHNYSEVFTGTQAYIRDVREDIRRFVRLIGVDRFPRADLEAMQDIANPHFGKATDLASVLWQNGMLGYINEAGQRRFYSLGDVEEFHFPPEVGTYVLHPCLVRGRGHPACARGLRLSRERLVNTIQILEYGSWHELKRDLFIELFGKSAFRPGRYLFRGMGNAEWKLSSSFDRRFSSLARDQRLRLWESLIEDWRCVCEDAGVPDSVVRNDERLWAFGQHHSLPTRLLDWTTSPYVAAFFAFQDWVLRLPEEFSHVVVWVLHLENPVWSKEMGVEIVTPPVLENIRLRNQGGKFTLSRTPFATLEEYVDKSATDLALTKVVLPAGEAEQALPDLDSMGINTYHLFPDPTGLAGVATMRRLLELRAEEGGGYGAR